MDKNIDDGGPAFPPHGWTSDKAALERMQSVGSGMSLRDYFAAAAMQGLLACDTTSMVLNKDAPEKFPFSAEGFSRAAYLYADAMIAERTKGKAQS